MASHLVCSLTEAHFVVNAKTIFAQSPQIVAYLMKSLNIFMTAKERILVAEDLLNAAITVVNRSGKSSSPQFSLPRQSLSWEAKFKLGSLGKLRTAISGFV